MRCLRKYTLAHIPSHWCTSTANVGDKPSVAIRLIGDNEEGLLDKTRNKVSLIKELRERGAPVQRFIGDPQEQNGFIVTVSQYLEGEVTDHNAYAQSLAKLHNAGTSGEIISFAEPFLPLNRTRKTLEYLTDLNQRGEKFSIQDVEFRPDDVLPAYKYHLEQGENAADEMLRLSAERHYPLTTIIHDAHMGNVRADSNGIATLIDLDGITAGPAEYDLGRPLGQWVQRFGRPEKYVQDFMAGYDSAIDRRPDEDLINLGIQVSTIRYAATLLDQAVEFVTNGYPVAGWCLSEGMKRVENIGKPSFAWNSQEKRRKNIV